MPRRIDDKDHQRDDRRREGDLEVDAELVLHLDALCAGRRDRRIGDDGEVVAEHRAADDRADVSGSDRPELATAAAIGTRTVIVPTLVPIAIEIRQAITNMPGTTKRPGMIESIRFAVLEAPPAALARPLKAPAIRKIKSMIVMLSSPIPSAQMWIFSSND